ncbi:MAG: hypothetical protein CMJ23_14450 [Phycisphaerae bacterium]|nr:hypothetical protein [Phycisphaerae bacterium]
MASRHEPHVHHRRGRGYRTHDGDGLRCACNGQPLRDEPSINGIVDLIAEHAGLRLRRRYVSDSGKRCASYVLDHAGSRAALGWEPSVGIAEGMRLTYDWVRDQIDSSSTRT